MDVNPADFQANAVLFTLKVKVKGAISSTSDVFSYATTSEFADAEGKVIEFNTLKISSIQSSKQSENLSIFPNPFNDNITLAYSLPASVNLTIVCLNATGQQIAVWADEYKTAGSYKMNINTSALAKGLYVVHISYKNENLNFSKNIKIMKSN